jgi:maltose-binding protein MalE
MRSRLLQFIFSLGLIFSAGCASLEPLLASLTPPAPVPTKQATATPARTPTQTVPVPPETPLLRVWLPPEFDPSAQNDAAKLLAQRLAEFEDGHPGLKIEVRVKKVEAENEIINVLSLTRVAAPSALPDLIIMSRPDLEAAAIQGLLHPIDGLSTALEDPNWYSYAQGLGRIQNTGYGLPFAGNALVLVYYPDLAQLVGRMF